MALRYQQGDTRPRGLSVIVRNGDISKAIRKFKKKVQLDGILMEYRDKQFYEKPTTIRKRKKAMAKKRWAKKLREIRKDM
jgi:small subunit ribosomal protein S21